jgi:biopolymer transport protein ExbD
MISRSRDSCAAEPLAEINVTPLVDVMLVLVAILLVIAPFVTNSMHIDIPKVASGEKVHEEHTVAMSLNAQGTIVVEGHQVAPKNLEPTLRNLALQNAGVTLTLYADQSQPFGVVANLLVKIRDAGIAHVAVATTTPDDPKP